MSDADVLLRRVMARLGDAGRIRLYPVTGTPGPVVEVRWRRGYDGVMSDERQTSEAGLTAALEAVLQWEDEADAEDAKRKQ